MRGKSERHRAARAKDRGTTRSNAVNTTDPDSKVMQQVARTGSVQGYNTQFAVTDDHLVVGVHITNDANDYSSFLPTLEQAHQHALIFDRTIDMVLMDAGYFTDTNLTAPGPDRLIAPGKNRDVHITARQQPTSGPPPADLSPQEAMAYRLRDPANIERYKRRGATVEPVFGHLKNRIRFRRLSRRGIGAASAELHFAAAILNLLRLRAAQPAT